MVVEDHSSEGGLSSQVADVIADFFLPCSLRRLGVNRYYPSGSAEALKIIAGLDAESIADAVQDELRTEVRGGEDALVTAIHSIPRNRNVSRFIESATPYIHRLKEERGYLESLRNDWKKRSAPEEKLPDNEALRARLSFPLL